MDYRDWYKKEEHDEKTIDADTGLVIDSVTGKLILGDELVEKEDMLKTEAGFSVSFEVDEETGMYINPDSGEMLSFDEAKKHNEDAELKAENDNKKVDEKKQKHPKKPE